MVAIVDNQIDEFIINSISHYGSDLNVTGWAVSEVEVMEYVRKLDATGRFSEITITNLSREASEEEEEEDDDEDDDGGDSGSEEDDNDIMLYSLRIQLGG